VVRLPHRQIGVREGPAGNAGPVPVFRDKRVDTRGVEVRGRGGKVALGGGVGLAGLLIYLLVNLLGGSGLDSLNIPGGTEIAGTGEDVAEMQARCNADGAIERYNDCFLVKVYNEINEVWADEIQGYQQPRLAFFEQGVQTGCGPASSEVGPFYCPPDQEIFIDIGFLQALQQQFGAPGRYAQAYILAHEVGHHLQTLFGTAQEVRAEQQRNPEQANDLSVAMELQADCYAGVWGRKADERGNVAITEAELDQALNAAAAVGDDRIQKKTQGQVDPESWTHGSAEQRRSWYLRGFRSANLGACDTFSVA
jgi:uncharacterized protein